MHSAAATLRMMQDPTSADWDWQPQPQAQEFIDELLITFLNRCPDAARFGERCLAETGTRISDWVGVILTPDTPQTRARLEETGYQPRDTEFVDEDIHYAFSNALALVPDILLTESDRMSIGLGVQSVADFFAAAAIPGLNGVQGEPLARARWARVFTGDNAAMWVFERHGYDGYHLASEPAESRIAALHHAERLRARPRGIADETRAFAELEGAARAAVDELGTDWAADIFMHAEIQQFMAQHCAGNQQTARQRALGLGLANTDHLVYAASSPCFGRTLDLFGQLGFTARESIELDDDYAHILEQPVTGHVVAILNSAADTPGAACSWTALLGESILSFGPAGLALKADPDALSQQIALNDGAAAKVCPLHVPDDEIDAAAAAGKLDDGFAHSLRNGGILGTVLAAVARPEGIRGFTPELLAWRTPGN